MKILKIYRRCLAIVFVLSIGILSFMVADYIDNSLPEKIIMRPNNVADIDVGVPVSLADKHSKEESDISSKLRINSSENGKYELIYKFLGVIPVKEVSVTVTNSKSVTPIGLPVGLYLHTNGVMVIGEGEITDANGNKCLPANKKVKANDYIVYFNDIKVNSKSQLMFLIKENGANKVVLKLNRNGKTVVTEITPVKDKNGEYKLGIWVRDDTQGIGTMTYVEENGNFGALGHGVSDIDTGELLDSTDGKIYNANIWGIKKGEDGNPGGLCGTIDYAKENILGEISKNTNKGLFGKLNNLQTIQELELKPMEVAYKQEIKKGKAYVQLFMDGKKEMYEIKIKKINLSDNSEEKNFVIEVTDKKLLSKTNGIVQGMSGSPIIQNGKLIGAVTHVFVDDPTRGYGIFIEEMLEH